MAPTGLEIYKLLPQTNCKECGFPTCLAFAMKLAQKGTELDKCPYVSDEAKAALAAASAPPIKLITIGAGITFVLAGLLTHRSFTVSLVAPTVGGLTLVRSSSVATAVAGTRASVVKSPPRPRSSSSARSTRLR